LFNPFPDDVKVSISGASEFGPEPLPEFNSVLVRGRSWVNVDLNPVVPLLDDLSLIVSAADGVVIPVMVLSGTQDGADQATWPGAGLSTVWYFANVTQSALSPTLAMTNPGDLDAVVTVDVFSRTDSIPAVVEMTIPAGTPLRIPLGDYVTGTFGIRVSSSQPVGAVVLAEDLPPEQGEAGDPSSEEEQTRFRLAGTVGADQAATTWLLPGAGGIPETESAIWVMNPSDSVATVSLEPLGVRDLAVEKMVVQPGRIRRYSVPDDIAIASYLISSPVPIVVSLTAFTPRSMAFLTGVPIGG
jgi:hypothetical protein